MKASHDLSRRSLLAGAAIGGAAGLMAAGDALAQAPGDNPTVAVDAERAAIKAAMAEADIGAAAIGMIDGGKPAWLEGFGAIAGANGRSVTPDALFSIQSTSKSFTAVAALIAVQEGLLDLDTPIRRYVPDFTVHSRFERAPEDRITLRLLLSNRAGFTHEARVGNNYEPASPSFEAHVRSISDSWLRFPVGDRYRYSNLGYDLAGYIVGKVSRLGYAGWLRRKLFAPLGMRSSTADPAIYTAVADRAVGRHRGYDSVPLVTPLVASGGVWTNARDMLRYARFHLGRGTLDGRQILTRELWEEMHGFGLGGDYGLGVMRSERRYGATPVRLLHHRGGGFGFGCNFIYCPEAQLAWVAMFNRPALAGYRFGERLIDRSLAERFGARSPRLLATALAPLRPMQRQARALSGGYVGRGIMAAISQINTELRLKQGAEGVNRPLTLIGADELAIRDPDGETLTYRIHPATATLPAHLECSSGEGSLDQNDGPDLSPGPDRPEWSRYVGRYRIDQWGRSAMNVAIERRRGYLYIDGIRMVVETEPGLFFTSDGEAVDFRSSPPTWRNLMLRPA